MLFIANARRTIPGSINATRLSKDDEPFRVVKLDQHRYACGAQYFVRAKRLFPTDSRGCYGNDASRCADVVHNNYIVTHEAKVYRFKEHLMWVYDKGKIHTVHSYSVIKGKIHTLNFASATLGVFTRV